MLRKSRIRKSKIQVNVRSINNFDYWKKYIDNIYYLSWEDKQDVKSVAHLWYLKYDKCIYKGYVVHRKIKAEVKNIKYQNREIRTVPSEKLMKNFFDKLPPEKRPIFYDQPSKKTSGISWWDFCYKSLTKEEYDIIYLFYKQSCSVNFIYKQTGVSRYRIKQTLHSAPKKMFADNQHFIKDPVR